MLQDATIQERSRDLGQELSSTASENAAVKPRTSAAIFVCVVVVVVVVVTIREQDAWSLNQSFTPKQPQMQ